MKAIRNEGASRLAQTVISAWKKVGNLDDDFKVTITGGLARNKNYCFAIFSNVQKLATKVELIDAAGDNLDGAIWIANNYKHDIAPMLGWARA